MQFPTIGHPRQIWIESERQLFSMAAMDEEQYKTIITAIRSMADALAAYETSEALVAAWPEAEALYRAAAAASGIPPQSLPHDKIAGAAFAMRDRKISEEKQLSKISSMVGEARDSGRDWVVLSETGNLEHGLMDPYGCTEMNLRSGLALITITQPEPSGGGLLHVLSVVRLDRETGQLVDAEAGIADWLEYASPGELETARAELRDRISDLSE